MTKQRDIIIAEQQNHIGEEMDKRFAFKGVCTFHSETGTEGGHWAFQDERFITPNTTHFYCSRCGLPWDKEKESEEDVFKKGEESELKYRGSPTLSGGMRHYCNRNAHEFKKISEKNWSYEGLHPLKNGDHLKIFSKEDPSKIVWEGTIQLQEYEVFSEHVFGMWIHSDQVGVERQAWAQWFFNEHPAELVTLE